MKDLVFKRNPATGRMGLQPDATNDVTFDDSEQHAVMASLVAARAQWWADTQGTFGSQIPLVRTITNSTQSDVEAYVRQALDWLIKAGRIALLNVIVTLPARGAMGRISVQVYWSARGGPEKNERIYF